MKDDSHGDYGEEETLLDLSILGDSVQPPPTPPAEEYVEERQDNPEEELGEEAPFIIDIHNADIEVEHGADEDPRPLGMFWRVVRILQYFFYSSGMLLTGNQDME